MKTKHFSNLIPFLMLWGSQSISALGTEMTNYALAIWVYSQQGDASSMTTLTLCSFLPTILLRFVAGALTDRWNKKRIMLLADLVAACGTLAILALYTADALLVVHLYVINMLLSLMNAFQVPAAYVATSLLVPKEHYTRAGGLQSVSGALVSILSPVLGALLLAWSGLAAVLITDLLTFALAFGTLLCIRIPKAQAQPSTHESLWQSCLSGVKYLRQQPHLLRMILYIAAVNFLAKLGPDGLMSVFILSRTGGEQTVLGLVQSAIALGLLAGGMLVTAMKPVKNAVRAIYTQCALIFLAGIGLAFARSPLGWCVATFLQYLFAAVMNVHWGALMRTSVPHEMQGRVFSARDTLQNCTIPLGLYLGGILADEVFTPLAQDSPALDALFGASGTGIALQFLLVALAGLALTLLCMFHRPDKAR